MRIVLALLCCLFLANCAGDEHYKEKMDRWVGVSEKQLVTSIGIPDKEYTVDRNTRMLAYRDRRDVEYPGTFSTCLGGGYGGRFGYNNCVGAYPGRVETYDCETTFMIVKGRVARWGTRGSGCRAY